MKKNKNQHQDIRIRIPVSLHQDMLADLRRPHEHALERVGFLFTSSLIQQDGTTIIIAKEYVPVADLDYEKDDSVGAKINENAIRKAMQGILIRRSGCFHVHLHDFSGPPAPGTTDQKSLPLVAESFSNISGPQPNGFLILSADSFYASVKIRNQKKIIIPSCISVVGFPMRFRFTSSIINSNKNRPDRIYDRQSFLGADSIYLFNNVKVSIIGYGGGGSHIGQQLSHLGVKNINVFDADIIEDSNLNRLIGGWFVDVKKSVLKTAIAKRTIKKIQPDASVNELRHRWQDFPEKLQSSDVVFGCVDSLAERQQLEAECRRWLIPYIDIGMDVFKVDNQGFAMCGQVILSMPGKSCLHCYKFLTPENLGEEAKRYGAAGNRPQVVWSNGVLASTSVGIFVDLITGWTNIKDKSFYLGYDGGRSTLTEHIGAKFVPPHCVHYPIINTGMPVFSKL